MEKSIIFFTKQPECFGILEEYLTREGWIVRLTSIEDFSSFESNETPKLACFVIPNTAITTVSLKQLEELCDKGHSLIVTSSAEDDKDEAAVELVRGSLNALVSKFGVEFNRDCVIRPNLYKSYHPKEVVLRDFIVNRGLNGTLRKYSSKQISSNDFSSETNQLFGEDEIFKVVYPEGCTIKASDNKLSYIMMTSARYSLPNDQPLCTFYKSPNNDCRMIALGSTSILTDQYINQEDNFALIKTLFDFIEDKSFSINISDAKTIETPEYKCECTPDLNVLVDIPAASMEQLDTRSKSSLDLVDKKLFSIDSSMLPEIHDAYKELGVTYEPLELIRPSLEYRSLKLKPAVYNFIIRK